MDGDRNVPFFAAMVRVLSQETARLMNGISSQVGGPKAGRRGLGRYNGA